MNDVFKALSDPTRRKILELLKQKDMSAGEIASHFDLAASTLSKHFSVLSQADLVWRDRQGTTITYSLNVSVLEEALLGLMSRLGLSSNGQGADHE